MASEQEIGVIKWLLDNLWAPTLAGVGAIWRHVNGKIDKAQKTAEAALPQVEFDKYQAAAEVFRKERREIEIKLFGEVGDVRKEMNAGFNDIKNILLERRK